MDYSYEKLEEQLLKLPQDLQQAVTSVGVAQLIREIAQENKLHIDQSDTFFGLTTYVMLGLLPMREFKACLVKEVGVNDEIAGKLMKEINEKIFVKVRESLQKIESDEYRVATAQTNTQNKGIVTAVEKAGNFLLESGHVAEQPDEILRKDEVLAGIENPVDNAIVNLAMKGPVVVQKQIEAKQAPVEQKPQESPIKKIDPYREPIL